MRKSIIIVSILVLLPFSVRAVQYSFYGRGNNMSFHKGTYGSFYTNGSSQRNGLGLSTELSFSNGPKAYGSNYVIGGQADAVYVKTGGVKSSSEDHSVSLSSGLPVMAKTTMLTNGDEDVVVSNKGFMETPDYTYDTPVGDGIIPLLIFLLSLVLYKITFRK